MIDNQKISQNVFVICFCFFFNRKFTSVQPVWVWSQNLSLWSTTSKWISPGLFQAILCQFIIHKRMIYGCILCPHYSTLTIGLQASADTGFTVINVPILIDDFWFNYVLKYIWRVITDCPGSQDCWSERILWGLFFFPAFYGTLNLFRKTTCRGVIWENDIKTHEVTILTEPGQWQKRQTAAFR